MDTAFEKKIGETRADSALQLKLYTNTATLVEKRKSAVSEEAFPQYQELRNQAHAPARRSVDSELRWRKKSLESR